MRYFITFSYNGTNYHGWQAQPNATSIQETLCKALGLLLNSKIELMGAGRTDARVHAKKMVAHFDSEAVLDGQTTTHKLNSFLPKDIAIYSITPVHASAHARFDAKKRTYEYHITPTKNVFLEKQSWYCKHNLDIDLMNKAAAILLSYTDFECFSKVNTEVYTFNCKIEEAYWKLENDSLIFTISADRFLRNMVRAIVGTLIKVGIQKINLADFNAIIESKDRSKAGFSVPAHGLYLTEITYEYNTN